MQGARRLREKARVLSPLPDTTSGITRDVGAIAVIEHDGSSYDMFEADGTTPNNAARARVALRFFETHGDNYDFLVVFTNFEFSTPGTLAFFNPVRSDVSGIGVPAFDLGPLYGSPGRLRGYVDMAALSRYLQPPHGLEPGTPGFLRTLGVVEHEVAHQWLAKVRYRDASGQPSSALLGQAGVHWSYLLDSDASVMYGSDWAANPNGTYTAVRTFDGYSALDLYLMGLLEPAKVAPLTLLRNPAVDAAGLPLEGARVTAVPETVTLSQVIAAEGARAPGYLASPKEFRIGFVFLAAPGTEPAPEDLEAVDRVREAFAGRFFALTRGVAVADTTLAEEPPPPPSPAPDLERALAWLLAQQSLDGRWEDAPGTPLRDTAAALEVLIASGANPSARERGRAWLNAAFVPNVDYLSRRARALSSFLSPTERGAFAEAILAGQTSGGGFGLGPGYEADALDTALALRALASLGHRADARVQQAFAALLALRHPSGGWAAIEGSELSTLVTAQVALALQDWPGVPEAQALLGPALGALLSRRNPDGGFGESPSTAYATALALEVLVGSGSPSAALDGAIAWLHRTQLADGSWGASRYQTALVIGALRGRLAANLTVPPDGLVLDPPAAEEGATVRVTARVRNVGRTGAGPQRARLYDGDPSLERMVDETVVGALAAGEEATVAFDFPTADRAGTHTLYVVADALDEVREAREDDNAASRALEVQGLLADLEITPIDIVVSPYPPEEGETVQVAVTVHNRGERASLPALVALTRGNPQIGGRLLGQATLPVIPAGGRTTVSFPWNTSGARGAHELFAVADVAFALDESDEANNQAFVPVTVTGPLPPGPDLEIARVQPAPARLSTLPQSVSLAVLVRNLGRDAASSTVALRGGPDGPLLAEQAVSLAGRSATTLTFPIDVTSPGDRVFWAVADPAGSLSETREDNNRASGTLIDPQDTLDLEIRPAEVTPSSTDLVVGQPLVVTAVIRNRGTAPVTNVPVILAHVTPSGPAELARQAVSLTPGAAFTASFTWTTAVTGESVPLAVIADSFGLLVELSEDNNRADLSVRIRPSAQPNLTLSGADIRFDPDPPLEGSTATVSALVRNAGTVAAGAFAVRFFRGDPDAGGSLISEASLAGLAAGATATTAVVWSPVDARGAQGVFVIVDAADAVAEYDEGDNRAFRPFSVSGLPDLVLAAGDVGLDPAYPRAGEPVTLRATVRNLGGQPAGPATLRAYEGQVGGPVIGSVAIPALPVGQSITLELPWTPAAPPGQRTLSLAADADDQVRESDEGNNADRRSVVVQDADLYLTEPYFSPDGDGVKDETRLAYRSTGTVDVVISDSLGRRVRTLAQRAPAAGSVGWDGRNAEGRLLTDGTYTLNLLGEGGRTLGRVQAVLDTNRSPIHDAAGTRLVAVRNVTCRLPSFRFSGPAWMPSEDEWLFIVPVAEGGFAPGLLRAHSDTEYAYVGAPDPWYANAEFVHSRPFSGVVSPAAVSPDGREVLIFGTQGLHAVDLATGQRRPLPEALDYVAASWSPDGRFILAGARVLARDGSLFAELPQPMSAWSPDSQFLAAASTIVRRDGTGLRTVPLPDRGQVSISQTVWREDGKIFIAGRTGGSIVDIGPRRVLDQALVPFLLDPETEALEEPRWLRPDEVDVTWSPDGTKALQGAEVSREDGTVLLLPSHHGLLMTSPRKSAAAEWSGAASGPGGACHGRGILDLFVVTSLQNLTAELQVSRLPGNNGLLVRGTATDRHLERAQLEYALASAPGTWHPIGAASDVPVLDDVLGIWVPPAPGSYLLRLRVSDRAGNERRRTQTVSWDRVPVLANITQDESLISPTGDGVKDAVRFRYLVQEPVHLEVRVLGPVPRDPAAPPPPTVRRLTFDYPMLGPASFVWDGRNDQGEVVSDGRYTVLLNDIPLRVDVDTTPPDIAYAFANLRSTRVGAFLDCPSSRDDPARLKPIDHGITAIDRSWHVVDTHLKSWQAGGPSGHAGTEQVYEFERDADGRVVYEDGVPRVLRRDGRVVDRRDSHVDDDGLRPELLFGASFEAEDYAGNRSVVSVPPVAERLFLLEMVPANPCLDPARRELPPILGPPKVYGLDPLTSFIVQGVTRAEAPVRFQYRRPEVTAWSETALPDHSFICLGTSCPSHPFLAPLGLLPGVEYAGRFVTDTAEGALPSEEFRFHTCAAVLDLRIDPLASGDIPDTDLAFYTYFVLAFATPEPLSSATLTVTGKREIAGFRLSVPMERLESGAFVARVVAPRVACGRPRELVFEAEVQGQSGRVYRHQPPCQKLAMVLPVCQCRLSIQPEQLSCAQSSPDRVFLEVDGRSAFPGSVLRLERGPESAPVVILESPLQDLLRPHHQAVDVTGLPEGELPVRGVILRPGVPPEEMVCVRENATARIDRTAPNAEFLEPDEGGTLCVRPDPTSGRETVRLRVHIQDAAAKAEIVSSEYRAGTGPWLPLTRICSDEDCRREPNYLLTNGPAIFDADGSGFGEGEHTVRLTLCDRAGNRRTILRRFFISRQPPGLQLQAVSRPVFSPNGDSRADDTTVTIRTAQALRLTAEVRRDGEDGPLVRTLVADQTFPAGDQSFLWNGRDGSGQAVTDGRYVLVVSAADACGGARRLGVPLEVDLTPPRAALTSPAAGAVVATSVDSRGFASDLHFLSYELAFGEGSAPAAWTTIRTSTVPAGNGDEPGLLGRWDPPATQGLYTLRLVAADAAENTAEARVTVNVAPRAYLERVAVTPSAFSPNGDGRRETVTLEYELRLTGRVSLQVRDAQDALLRTLEASVEHGPGLQAFTWDGRTDAGAPAPEGEHRLWVRVEDPAGAGTPQEQVVAFVLDRTPPQTLVDTPAAGAYLTRGQPVRGTVSDSRLSSYVVEATPQGGGPIELARGSQNRIGVDLASLALLADGPHTLAVSAEDAAENRSQTAVPFVMDSLPPVARLLAPTAGAVLRKGTAPIDVVGTATDASLQDWILSFGAGPDPAHFVEIARGTTSTSAATLSAWAVASLPDGVYTLRLSATDRAAQAAEARATITLDGTSPTASLTAPTEGAFVGSEGPVTGTASDTNLASWTLEMAPGAAATAFQWSELATGTATVTSADLATLAPLPPNGLQTLKLTVRDRAGQSASALRTFTVDTVPPPSPAPLTGVVEHGAGSTADVRLSWTAVDASDLAGYVLSRDGTRLTPTPIAGLTFTDPQRPDGRYAYSVVAVDRAGNASTPAPATVRVDLAPPIADILTPHAGAPVFGPVDVRGTAFSADDFKEYRLLVGTGASPTSWTLLARSTLTVSGGVLGTWTAIGDGPHVLALEAEDVSGNLARATVGVTVDGQAPGAPVLTSVAVAGTADTLRAIWQASPEADVDGYLVYRNGRIANAPGLVIGSPRAYLLPGPSYDDPALPDGRHCYRVTAMDRADNLSPPSNERCETLENRRPHAVILEPASGARFEFPIRILADTPDRDVTAVQFQYKPDAEADWRALGAPDTQEPFEVTFDPAGLAHGQYNLRAVARDAGGQDPAPTSITVVFGDTTPPPVPPGLNARVTGVDVRLTWTAASAPDLQGYHVYRGAERLTTTPITALEYNDAGRPVGTYLYRVSAVDQDGNESAPSEPQEAIVYAVDLDPPFPVTSATAADLTGRGARESITVEVRREATVLAEVPAAAGGAFSAPNVPLQGGPNLLRAQGRDAAGNRSIPSSEVALIANMPPPTVTGLQATASGLSVDLSWTPVSDPELFGYAVRRGPTELTPSAPQQTADSIAATSSQGGHEPAQAFDGNPATAWVPQSSDAAPMWTLTFPQTILVEKVALSFGSASGPAIPSHYRIEVAWEGRFLPVARVSGNGETNVVHVLPSAFATSAVRVVLEPFTGLAEVAITKRALLPVGAVSFHDPAVADGRHVYEVAAVDRYGAQGPAATREVAVGDVIPPAPPTGLAAAVEGSDVILSWTANTEPDLDHYVVRRDGSPIASADTPQFRDESRPNGTYTYAVLAVDRVGNASDPSAPATAVVAITPPAAPVLSAAPAASGAVALQWTHAGATAYTVHRAAVSGGPYLPIGRTGDARSFLDGTATPALPHFYVVHAEDAHGNPSPASNEASATPQRTTPPDAPVILVPTDAANPIELAATETPVAGRAEASSLVSIEVDGLLAGITEAGPGFVERTVSLLEGASSPTASADGRRAAYSFDSGERAIYWTDVMGLASGVLLHPGGGDAEPRAFSPDGNRLAYQVRRCPGGACSVDLYLAELPSGDTTPIENGPDTAGEAAFSPSGDRLAFVSASESGGCQLRVRDLASGQTTPVTSATGCRHPRWSPDGTRIALLAQTTTGGPYHVRIVELPSLAVVTVEDTAWANARPAWTADGAAIAYTSTAAPRLKLRRYELSSGMRGDLTDGSVASFDARLDPEGRWLSFSTWEAGIQKVIAQRLDRGTQQEVHTRTGVSAPEAFALHEWTGRQALTVSLPNRLSFFPTEGSFQVDGVRLHPGENTLVAFAIEQEAGLTSAGSLPVRVTVPAGLHPDLAISADDLSTYPGVPLVGQPTRLSAHVRNIGDAPAIDVPVRLSLRDGSGNIVWEQEAQVSEIAAGGSASVSAPWTPPAAGSYGLRVDVDPSDTVAEAREDNNRADRGVYVVASGVAVEVRADREAYTARAPAVVTVRLANGGPSGAFTARATVETANGTEVAVLDSRALSLSYGQPIEYTLPWNTGTVYAGDYAFRVRVQGGSAPAEGSRSFRILPDLSATARIVAEADHASVPVGSAATFAVHVQNTGANAPLEQAVARLLILPAGSLTPVHTAEAAVPRLLPGAAWDGSVFWPVAAPAGDYQARLEVRLGTQPLATAGASFRVTSSAPSLGGTLQLEPAQLLGGDPFTARAVVTNRGTSARVAQAFAVEVTAGASSTVLVRGTFTLDLAPGQTRTSTVTLPTTVLAPGLYPVFLRVSEPMATLDRATLQVHGPITPPTIDSPAIGATVTTTHPMLRVNNATASVGAIVGLTYQFQLFSDAGLTRPLPGASGVAETPLRTSWRVAINLAEDHTYYWRARAGDGFSFSAWTAVGSFTVDERNEPPPAPVPDSPAPGARVPSREPLLVVTNAADPETDALTYEFRLATDPQMAAVVASATDVPEGLAFTSWRVPVTLTENTVYYWSARAHDAVSASPWSAPLSFMVDTADEAPSAPTPLRPVAEEVAQLQPALVVRNSTDPESRPLTCRFEIDVVPTFDSPSLQASPPVAESPLETSWTPPLPLADNSVHYWRAAAHDGHSAGAWASAQFFVNQANDPPGVPVPLDPPDHGIVTTSTPTLRVLNASDLDGDTLTYEFALTDGDGAPVAGAAGVPAGSGETTWTVPAPLAENARFLWRVRASDGEATGGWTAAQEFRVNAVPDPPTAPTLVAPPEGALVNVPRPALVVSNAVSPEGLPLTYTFELFAVGADDVLTLVDRIDGVPEGSGLTEWTPTLDLADGLYSWRSRAADPSQPGPWMPSARFRIALDPPPAPPTGLLAVPGDARVRLTWNASPEPDVVGYRVYRATTSGGPYPLVASPTAPLHDDTGLANGVTVYYVVTAFDARSESARSAEVAATPAPAVLQAEVRYTPETLRGECLVRIDHTCPAWVYATAELPVGFDPATIAVSTVRLGGQVSPDPFHHPLVDSDQDGILEMELRFPFDQVRPLLAVGTTTLSLSGRASEKDFRGEDTLTAAPLVVKLRMTPRTLNRSSQGQVVQARLDFIDPVYAADVNTASLRLNETLPIERVVSSGGLRLTVKFDRAAVIALLPLGDAVEVRISGIVGGVPFVAVDFIRVIP